MDSLAEDRNLSDSAEENQERIYSKEKFDWEEKTLLSSRQGKEWSKETVLVH